MRSADESGREGLAQLVQPNTRHACRIDREPPMHARWRRGMVVGAQKLRRLPSAVRGGGASSMVAVSCQIFGGEEDEEGKTSSACSCLSTAR